MYIPFHTTGAAYGQESCVILTIFVLTCHEMLFKFSEQSGSAHLHIGKKSTLTSSNTEKVRAELLQVSLVETIMRFYIIFLRPEVQKKS